MRIWPFDVIAQACDYKRKSRERIAVGTAIAKTTWKKNGQDTGLTERHVIVFYRDGNGRRFSEIESTNREAALEHDFVVTSRVAWRIHGELPYNVHHVDERPRGKLTVFPGGKAS